MLIYVKKRKKKKVFYRTDGRTDTLSTQNYSSEPHKTSQKTFNKFFLKFFFKIDTNHSKPQNVKKLMLLGRKICF